MPNRVRFKIGENEVDVEGNSKFIEGQLKRFFQLIFHGQAEKTTSEIKIKKIEVVTPKKSFSPAEYIRLKQPKGGTEILLVLAKYLEEYRSLTDFTQKDINGLADEAKIKDVHGQYFTLAVKQGLLKMLDKRRYSLTLSGEDAVLAMPKTSK